MTTRYRYPLFTHFSRKASMFALYNSLVMRPVYVDEQMFKIIKSFGDGETVQKISLTISQEERQELNFLIPYLEGKKILIDESKTNEDFIEDYRNKIITPPYVSVAYFILTDACNFSCKYCFIKNRMSVGHKCLAMSQDTVREGIDFFIRLINLDANLFQEKKSIVIYGGEPLINHECLIFLLEEVRRRKKSGDLPLKTEISMVTNGALITEKIAQLLKEHEVGVAVSIDGDEEATDSARQYANGKPVFKDVVRGFNLLRDAKVKTGVSCTLNQKSIDNFDATIKTIVEDLKVDGLGFNIVIPDDDYQLSVDYHEKATRAIIRAFEIFRKKNIYEDRIMRKVRAFADGKLYPFDCAAAGGEQIVIAPDGEVGICHGYISSRKYFTTNVNDTKFKPKNNPVFMEWSRRSPLYMDDCRECAALGICGGGCPFLADSKKGSIWSIDEAFCLHSSMILEWMIWDLYEQVSKKNIDYN